MLTSVKPFGIVATAFGLLAEDLTVIAEDACPLFEITVLSSGGPSVGDPMNSMLASAKPVLLGDSIIRNLNV
jgi:hypothetical protein